MKNSILSAIEIYKIQKEKKKYENILAASIESLKIVQNYRGWISDDLVCAIAKVLCISPSELDEVATFYSQIYRKPVARNVIRYCDSVVCYIMGCKNIKSTLENILKIKIGQMTNDKKFTLLPISCLGNCDKAPVLMINHHTYNNVKVNYIPILLEKYR
ncbi:NADH-quinone oxidoreductase subunit NuoE [Buchnera aphidicola]|uniref:NADH-quinone oxidoreductase subunit NuoE n=1 Tax=Buchnera aphidicola TaxID=9 RepID=UPI003463A3FF